MKKLSFLMCVVVMQAYAADSLPAAMRAAAQPSEHQVEGERKALVCALDEAMQRLDITLQQVRQSVAQRAAQPTSADIKTLMARLARVEDENQALKELLPQYRQEAQDRTSAINLTLARNSITHQTPEDLRVQIERTEAIGKNYDASLRAMKSEHHAHARVSRESRLHSKIALRDAIIAKLITQRMCQFLDMDYNAFEGMAIEALDHHDWEKPIFSKHRKLADALAAAPKAPKVKSKPNVPAKKVHFPPGTAGSISSQSDVGVPSESDNGTAREDSLSSVDKPAFEDDDAADLFSAGHGVVAAVASAAPAGLSGVPGVVGVGAKPLKSSLKKPRNDSVPASSAAAADPRLSTLPMVRQKPDDENADDSGSESDLRGPDEELSSDDEKEHDQARNTLPNFHRQLAPPPSHLFDRDAVLQAGALSGVVDNGTAASVLSVASKASSVESGDSEPRSIDSGDVDPKPAPLSREQSLTGLLGFSLPMHGEQGNK